MIGMLVTGHGTFATGLTSGLKLLAGEPEDYKAVDFLPGDSGQVLEGKLTEAIQELSDCDGILILTDLLGGSPFNTSLRLKLEGKWKLEVIGGCNLAAVIDACMSRGTGCDVTALGSASTQAGREQMVHYVQQQPDNDDYEES